MVGGTGAGDGRVLSGTGLGTEDEEQGGGLGSLWGVWMGVHCGAEGRPHKTRKNDSLSKDEEAIGSPESPPASPLSTNTLPCSGTCRGPGR